MKWQYNDLPFIDDHKFMFSQNHKYNVEKSQFCKFVFSLVCLITDTQKKNQEVLIWDSVYK